MIASLIEAPHRHADLDGLRHGPTTLLTIIGICCILAAIAWLAATIITHRSEL